MIQKIFLGLLIGGFIGAGLGYFGKCSSGTCPLTANPYRGAVYGAVMGVLIALTFSGTPTTQPAHIEEGKESASDIVQNVTDDSFQSEVLHSTLPVMIDLWAPWCGPCRMVSPVMGQLAEGNAGSIKACKINLDQNVKVARRYRINAIPAILFFKDGEELERLRMVGVRPKAAYQKAIDAAIGLGAGD